MPLYSGAALWTFMAIFVADAAGNLTCVCNKDELSPLRVMNSTNSASVIGYLNPRQCRTFVRASSTNSSLLIIKLNGQLGYLEHDPDFILIAECPETHNEMLPTTTTISAPAQTTTSAGTPGCDSPHLSDNAIPSYLEGNVSLCPKYIVHAAKSFCNGLTQHRQSCYEMTPTRVSWQHAQQQCLERGGNLVTIHNFEENDYVHQVLMHMNFTFAVWIGLHDRVKEGHYEWVTGQPVSYTNWSEHAIHDGLGPGNTQDCTVIKPSGQWDDIHCGGNDPVSEIGNTTHAYICEYRLHPFGTSIIG